MAEKKVTISIEVKKAEEARNQFLNLANSISNVAIKFESLASQMNLRPLAQQLSLLNGLDIQVKGLSSVSTLAKNLNNLKGINLSNVQSMVNGLRALRIDADAIAGIRAFNSALGTLTKNANKVAEPLVRLSQVARALGLNVQALGISSASASAGLQSLGASGREASRGFNAEAIRKQTQTIEESQSAWSKLSAVWNKVFSISNALGGYTFGKISQGLIHVTDTITNYENRIKALGYTQERTNDVFDKLWKISVKSGSGLEGVTKLYSRLNMASEKLGKSESEMLRVTETINKSFKLAGASTQEATNAMIQLSQAFSSGRLQGDELRSVVENNAIMARMLRKEFGDNFRQLASEGKLTTTALLNMFLKNAKDIDRTFENIDLPIADRVSAILEGIEIQFSRTIKSMGVTEVLGAAFKFLAENIETVARTLMILTLTTIPLFISGVSSSIGVSLTFAGVMTALKAQMLALWAVMMAHPFTAIVTALTLAVSSFILFKDSINLYKTSATLANGATVDLKYTLGDAFSDMTKSIKGVTDNIAKLKDEILATKKAAKEGTDTGMGFAQQLMAEQRANNKKAEQMRLASNFAAGGGSIGLQWLANFESTKLEKALGKTLTNQQESVLTQIRDLERTFLNRSKTLKKEIETLESDLAKAATQGEKINLGKSLEQAKKQLDDLKYTVYGGKDELVEQLNNLREFQNEVKKFNDENLKSSTISKVNKSVGKFEFEEYNTRTYKVRRDQEEILRQEQEANEKKRLDALKALQKEEESYYDNLSKAVKKYLNPLEELEKQLAYMKRNYKNGVDIFSNMNEDDIIKTVEDMERRGLAVKVEIKQIYDLVSARKKQEETAKALEQAEKSFRESLMKSVETYLNPLGDLVKQLDFIKANYGSKSIDIFIGINEAAIVKAVETMRELGMTIDEEILKTYDLIQARKSLEETTKAVTEQGKLWIDAWKNYDNALKGVTQTEAERINKLASNINNARSEIEKSINPVAELSEKFEAYIALSGDYDNASQLFVKNNIKSIQELAQQMMDADGVISPILQKWIDQYNALGKNQITITAKDSTKSKDWVKNEGDKYLWDSIGLKSNRNEAEEMQELVSLSEQLKENFADIASSAVDGLANGIADAITGTKEWGQVLRELGQNVLKQILATMIKIAVQALILKLVTGSFTGASGGNAAPQAFSQGGYVPMDGFADGGYTGNKGVKQIAGIVHGGEYVLDAQTTKYLGKPLLDHINDTHGRSLENKLQGFAQGGYVPLGGNPESASQALPFYAKSGSLAMPNVVAQAPVVNIENYGTSKEFDVQIDENMVRIIAQDEARKEVRTKVPGLVSGQLASANSSISKALGRNTSANRRR